MDKKELNSKVKLLVETLSIIKDDKSLALKGGVAINYFHNEVPRYSVDIDLAYMPVKNREDALKDITKSVSDMKSKIESETNGYIATPHFLKSEKVAPRLYVNDGNTEIKVEINTVIRGSVYSPEKATLSKTAQEEFEAYIEFNTLNKADIYGGKMCAALDRQLARDLFDMKVLFDSGGGITEEMRKAFLVYLASGPRPMSELLQPNLLDFSDSYNKELLLTIKKIVSISELEQTRKQLITYLKENIKQNEKEFLLSIKEGEPDWNKLEIKGIDKLAGIRWKVENIKKMSSEKRLEARERLKRALDF